MNLNNKMISPWRKYFFHKIEIHKMIILKIKRIMIINKIKLKYHKKALKVVLLNQIKH